MHLLAGTDDLIEGTASHAILATLAEQRTGIAETAERLVGELRSRQAGRGDGRAAETRPAA